jgi:hypothetical protein
MLKFTCRECGRFSLVKAEYPSGPNHFSVFVTCNECENRAASIGRSSHDANSDEAVGSSGNEPADVVSKTAEQVRRYLEADARYFLEGNPRLR